jgi:hypothetical protein
LNTDLPQIPTRSTPADGNWARSYGQRLGSLYQLEDETPADFRDLAARIAARCAECDRLAEEIDDVIIL